MLGYNIVSKYSPAYVTIFKMAAWHFLTQCLSRTQWLQLNSDFHSWPLHTEISPLQSFHHIMYCRLFWRLFATLHWEIFFLNALTILSQSLSQTFNEPLVDACFIPNHDPFTSYQLMMLLEYFIKFSEISEHLFLVLHFSFYCMLESVPTFLDVDTSYQEYGVSGYGLKQC